MLMSVPWDTDGLTVESMARNRGKHVIESPIQDEAPGGPVHLETARNDEVSNEVSTADESKRDRCEPSSSKSCEGFKIGW